MVIITVGIDLIGLIDVKGEWICGIWGTIRRKLLLETTTLALIFSPTERVYYYILRQLQKKIKECSFPGIIIASTFPQSFRNIQSPHL